MKTGLKEMKKEYKKVDIGKIEVSAKLRYQHFSCTVDKYS